MGRILSGAGNGAINIGSPFPELIKGIKCNRYAAFPHPSNDGSFIEIPGSVNICNAAGAITKTVSGADINAAANNILNTLWLDTVDGAVWVIAVNSTTYGGGYLAKINYTTGVVTKVGVGFSSPNTIPYNGSVCYTLERDSMGIGNLTLRNGTRQVVLSTATGAAVGAESLLVQNGASPDINVSYRTVDGLLYAGLVGNNASSSAVISLRLMRGGVTGQVAFDASQIGGLGGGTQTGYYVFVPWGIDALYLNIQGQTDRIYGPRNFKRSSFDIWLHRIADSMGLPQ